jgi:hypothetical protein
MSDAGSIRLTLPRERRFRSVANLVLGGIALQRELSVEALDDLQLALGALLDRAGSKGEIEIDFTLGQSTIGTRVGPLRPDDEPREPEEGLGLHRVLGALVDEVRLDGEFVELSKSTA